ncbi:MAG: hypothetical protein K1X82_15385, partial [Bacteroidia bacterium]|nr:hypothetical protein [Bacteroidia bacterium]
PKQSCKFKNVALAVGSGFRRYSSPRKYSGLWGSILNPCPDAPHNIFNPFSFSPVTAFGEAWFLKFMA